CFCASACTSSTATPIRDAAIWARCAGSLAKLSAAISASSMVGFSRRTRRTPHFVFQVVATGGLRICSQVNDSIYVAVQQTNSTGCYGKVEMSPLNKVEMSPFVEAGGGRFERGHFGDERGGAGAVLRIATCDARRVATGSRCGA